MFFFKGKKTFSVLENLISILVMIEVLLLHGSLPVFTAWDYRAGGIGPADQAAAGPKIHYN